MARAEGFVQRIALSEHFRASKAGYTLALPYWVQIVYFIRATGLSFSSRS